MVVFFISPPYVGSISDVELTCVIKSIEDKPGISVMADRDLPSRTCWSQVEYSTIHGRTKTATVTRNQ